MLIVFTSKSSKRNTTKKLNIFIHYLSFIIAVFIHSCHYHLKMSSFSLKKNKFWSIESALLVINTTTAIMILNCLEHKFLKDFWSKGDSSHFENSSSFQISWTWSVVFKINENFIQQLSAIFTCQDGKDGELSNQAPAG